MQDRLRLLLIAGLMTLVVWALFVYDGKTEATPVPLALTPTAPVEEARGVQDVVMTRGVDEYLRPLEPTNTFAPEETFYCSVQVQDLREGTILAAKWYQGSDLIGEEQAMLSQAFSGHLKFKLAPVGVWEVGDYALEVYLDGELAGSATFEVRTFPRLLEMIMATRVDENKVPLEPTESFATDDIFYCSALVADIPAGGQLAAKWYLQDGLLGKHTLSFPEGFTGYAAFNVGTEQGWPEGEYRVDLYIEDELAGSKPFQVGPLTAPMEMSSYINEILGFSLFYPRGWELEASQGRVAFTKPDGTAVFTVIAGELAEERSSRQFAEEFIAVQRENYPNLAIISAGDSTLGGQPAYRVNYTYLLGRERVNSFLLIAVRERVFFLIDSTNQELTLFNVMWKTFSYH